MGRKFGELILFEHLVKESLANRSANRLSIVNTKLDGFSLANHRQFANFTKLSRYTVYTLTSTPQPAVDLAACIHRMLLFLLMLLILMTINKSLAICDWACENRAYLHTNFGLIFEI